METETAVVVCQLIGRKSQVEQNPIHMRNGQVVEDLPETGIAGLNEMTVGTRNFAGGNFQHLVIAVKTDQRSGGPDSLQNLEAVAPGPFRSVDNRQSLLQLQHLQHFAEEYGNMYGFGAGHKFTGEEGVDGSIPAECDRPRKREQRRCGVGMRDRHNGPVAGRNCGPGKKYSPRVDSFPLV